MSYLTGGRDLLSFGTQPTEHAAPPLIMGAPAFNLDLGPGDPGGRRSPRASALRDELARTGRFCDLAGTLVESTRIAALLGVEAVTGCDALKSYITSARSPVVLHLATHGFFLHEPAPPADNEAPETSLHSIDQLQRLARQVEDPMIRSGVALAGAETWRQCTTTMDDAENGILTAEEIAYLDLRRTALVVLSACDTGLGDIRLGEGVLGLRRAFHIAGAHTIVMSLWKVHDWATSELMGTFYENLIAGIDRAGALRAAQLKLKNMYAHPYYWAAFICEGDPGPIRTTIRTTADDESVTPL